MTESMKLVDRIGVELEQIRRDLPTSRTFFAESRLSLLLDIIECSDFPHDGKRELSERMGDIPNLLRIHSWHAAANRCKETLQKLRDPQYDSEEAVHGLT